MRTPVQLNNLKLAALVFILSFFMMCAIDSNAQLNPSFRKTFYRGLQASYGRHVFKSESNFAAIDRSEVHVDGGQLSLVLGTDVLRLNVGLIGYYSSVSNVVGTIDVYTNHVSVKYYPLSAGKTRRPALEPYIGGGISYDRTALYGYYATPDAGYINYSKTKENYIGSIRELKGNIAAGLEFKILDNIDFVHLFTEVRYRHHLQGSTNREVLSATSFENHLMFNVGVAFGKRK